MSESGEFPPVQAPTASLDREDEIERSGVIIFYDNLVKSETNPLKFVGIRRFVLDLLL